MSLKQKTYVFGFYLEKKLELDLNTYVASITGKSA